MCVGAGTGFPKGYESIGHQAEGGYPDVPQTNGFPQQCDEAVIIGIVFKHLLATTTAIHHMAPGAGNSIRKGSAHALKLTRTIETVKRRLDP